MKKFFSWFQQNRQSIGYTVGGLNALTGVANLAIGHFLEGIFWIVIGTVIIVDTKYFK